MEKLSRLGRKVVFIVLFVNTIDLCHHLIIVINIIIIITVFIAIVMFIVIIIIIVIITVIVHLP